MRKGQQFKIESIEELKDIYDKNPENWYWPLKMEITDFEMGMNYAVNHNGKYLLLNKSDEYETIPNPFKKEETLIQKLKEAMEDEHLKSKRPEPFLKALDDFHKAAESMKTLIKVAEWVKERKELIEELKALRKEVDKIRRIVYPKGGVFVDQGEIIFNRRKEKPKESPEQKGMLQLNWNHCGLELTPKIDYMDLTVKDGRDVVSMNLKKDHAIKIVDYLKKHFEI